MKFKEIKIIYYPNEPKVFLGFTIYVSYKQLIEVFWSKEIFMKEMWDLEQEIIRKYNLENLLFWVEEKQKTIS